MTNSAALSFHPTKVCSLIWQIIFVALVSFVGALAIYSQQQTTITQNEENTIIVDEIKGGEVFAFGKTVIIKKTAKGVLVFGGDVIIEGSIDEDAAVIGGSVIQRNNAFIGGDVIVFGGKYQHERDEPLRNSDKETVLLYSGYEDELRRMTQNPTEIFSPQLTVSYIAWRIVSVLFWFVVTLLLTTIAPGLVGRSVARFQLSTEKIVGLGLLAFISITVFVIISIGYFPTVLGATVSLLGLFTILAAYFFGRVTFNVSLGKYLQKQLLPERFQSETVGIFVGTLAWVTLLSIPYLGNLLIILLFGTSLGLAVTARSDSGWKSL